MNSSLSLHRTGGVAGFNDKLVVEADGSATLTSRGKEPFTCSVKSATMTRIAATADRAEKAPRPKAAQENKKKLHTPTPDAIHLYLTVGEEQISYEDIKGADQSYRDLFDLMNDVMSSASTLRKGGDGAAQSGSVCT
ncbi:hypothetical protein SAMN05421678_101541 [Actinopolymorpha cephalotaxi]|uniref:Uncharacterized protein n=1 Tax=Actinopolymorpha cephalotaxi TaxID=504797 RepID=A0A1I2KZW6_9ACTN|nr:hypothetical protein [Actinopolymorpha cephalotaxi]NYH84684.1 hypothetical protein [Actinopolymorpha cephalotaxi]SFF70717.1 hypothetical protein SAMN05421678_101541 [Actinopolymorpha cephalotaxi]